MDEVDLGDEQCEAMLPRTINNISPTDEGPHYGFNVKLLPDDTIMISQSPLSGKCSDARLKGVITISATMTS